TLASAIASAR
nr:RecName: Full=Uncharacterized protein IMPP4 [Nautilus macromphalus]